MFNNSLLTTTLRTALIAGGAYAVIPAAFAQEQATDSDSGTIATSSSERISVIGSRIRRDGLDSDTPIEVISAEMATEMGINTVGELLRTATVASGSNQLISAMSVGSVTAGGAGNESISMRGLGANRTLVLLNGRRAGPAGTRGEVSAFDMNALPISAIERVEILKDGASSLYGSDAVAGVINIITKRGDDSSINVNVTQPFESGGETYRINGTLGRSFSAGSWRVVGDYRLDQELKRGDRDYFGCQPRYFFDRETNERVDPIDPRTGEFHCNALESAMWLWDGGAENYLGGRLVYDYDGSHAAAGRPQYNAVNPGDMSVPEGWYPVGFDYESDGWTNANHPFVYNQSMIPRQEVASLFGQFDYDLSDNISMYGELMYSRRETQIAGYRQFWEPFIPGGVVDGFDGDMFYDPTPVTDHSGSTTTIDYVRGVVGFEGAIGFWNWDASYQRSFNRGTYDTKLIYEDSLELSHDVLWGDPCSGVVTSISNRPCVEVPWFTPEFINGEFSQDVRDFLFGEERGRTYYKQDTFDAYITGDLYELPAGQVGAAFGFSYQTDEIVDTPGEQTLQGNAWGSTSAGITQGSAETTAFYGELQIPVVRDLPFMESFDLTASGRWTDVSTYGSGTTYKVGANWTVGNGFRVRASRGTSFRAPALFELFLENQTSFISQNNDPCLNWGARLEEGSISELLAGNCSLAGVPADYAVPNASMTSYTGGGAGVLEAETSVSNGLGVVWSTVDNRFGASIDLYDIEISGQVDNVGGMDVVNGCYFSEDFANEPLCSQITRHDGTGNDWGIDEIYGGFLNVASQRVRGSDIMFSYMDDTPIGFVRFTLNHTIQFERTYQQFVDSPEINYVGRLGNPRHSGTAYLSVENGDWKYNWQTRYYGSVDNYDAYTNGRNITYRGIEAYFVSEASSVFYHTASVARTWDNFEVTLGVANIFDTHPPRVSPSYASAVGNSALYSQYDLIGRRAFLNLEYQF
ncbi:TonB-dependent receptor plug domain-containing protein [Aliidiomarina maris]|uniref:TonB-dependent receptor n=1 Tax=Aliidiomarina maris TaxID=531312 RepID=A0A327XC39_9GAMM|nr:TonB-dependent receptor [Aliidiomarina maris]RAK01846.1 TonB-dependent receptor-like protein [Aliidiomarina maris]RUO28654.1 TonB-dependent receptor [Aliidiomarina maris]